MGPRGSEKRLGLAQHYETGGVCRLLPNQERAIRTNPDGDKCTSMICLCGKSNGTMIKGE